LSPDYRRTAKTARDNPIAIRYFFLLSIQLRRLLPALQLQNYE
jgi:hypothetical protein